MSLHALSSNELLIAVKTHVAYINIDNPVVEKFELPVEKVEKSVEKETGMEHVFGTGAP